MVQELKDMNTAGNIGVTTGKPEITFAEMLNTMGGSLSNIASSDDEQDGEDKEDDEEVTRLGKLSDDDEPGWVMGTVSKMVRHHMESFQQMQMRLNDLTQSAWRDAANYICKNNMNDGTAALNVPAVVKPQIHMTAAIASVTTAGEQM
jgi:hypothetical protein